MNAFAVVRGAADLVPACNDLSEFLSLRLQQYPTSAPEPLLGLWIDPRLVEDIPPVMTLPNGLSSDQIRIRESTGPSAIWTLCWFDSMGEANNSRISRHALLGALLAASKCGRGPAPSGAFIPVFRTDAETSGVRAEMHRLRSRHPHHVMGPLFQDPLNGRLSPPYTH
jgi:hypothetical protein